MLAQLVGATKQEGLKTLYQHALTITCTKDVLGRIFEEDFRMRLQKSQESSEPLQLVYEVRFD
jgi:hypothetical protein